MILYPLRYWWTRHIACKKREKCIQVLGGETWRKAETRKTQWLRVENRWNDTDDRTLEYSEKNLFQCHFANHKSPLEKKRSSTVTGRRLTAWAMAKPGYYKVWKIHRHIFSTLHKVSCVESVPIGHFVWNLSPERSKFRRYFWRL
jgi:hypothetical protein